MARDDDFIIFSSYKLIGNQQICADVGRNKNKGKKVKRSKIPSRAPAT